MKLQFDPNQPFQIDAVNAVADLFDGQPIEGQDFAPTLGVSAAGLFTSIETSELGVGNRLLLGDGILLENTRSIQDRNDVEYPARDGGLEAWDVWDAPANLGRRCPHFSVEMETGTGKTYVYLRTIFELSRRYGFKKFVIVVPSVAIREGVLKNLQITAEHFRVMYGEEPRSFVYDSKQLSRLREFATSNALQIQIINIQAFAKNFAGPDTGKSNVIYKDSDKLSGRPPIEYVQAARPIVIIDEPQSVDSTERSQEAIKALNPLVTLRYSATHRNPYNLVYRLDPIKAFDLRLVKQIIVAGAAVEGGNTDAFVRVESVSLSPIGARLAISQQGGTGPKVKTVSVRQGHDLFAVSNERAEYRTGYEISEINAEPGREFVRFANGTRMTVGQERGGIRDDVWRAQIKHTVKRHLETELALHGRGIKVLTLFFIDRVANYRSYDDSGHAVQGKFAEVFETELAQLLHDPDYSSLPCANEAIDRLHNGYFSADKKGVLKDTNGATQADDDVYDLIMKDKERLLSPEEPLRFIFSHSALREGWDNPNVFQICTLNESRSAVKKRQEIGRGLRLPVDSTGVRVFDDSINKLYVMANESYEDFAKSLQTEYEEDCGVTFGKVPLSAFRRLTRVLGDAETPVSAADASSIRDALVAQGMLAVDGRILPVFQPSAPNFALELPPRDEALTSQVIDLLSSYRLERHIRRERDDRANPLKKAVELDADFATLWERIKPRTTYRVEFESTDLVARSVAAIKAMERIEQPRIEIKAGRVTLERRGVTTTQMSVAEERVDYGTRAIPDVLTYLQGATDLTRSTLVRILTECGRLVEFFNDPQRFMDAVAAEIKGVLQALVVDGVKYERLDPALPNADWEMVRFEAEELVNYLTAIAVEKSIYPYVVYDSEVERKFAEQLDQRDDIKLFVKLPRWFRIDTPVGEYNPDWAIVKHDGQTLYLARETKSTHDFMKLRHAEALKVRCGARHFAAIGVPFAVVTQASEV